MENETFNDEQTDLTPDTDTPTDAQTDVNTGPSETFEISPTGGLIEISDFDLSADTLDFSEFIRSDVSEALINATGTDRAVLNFFDGTEIVLTGDGVTGETIVTASFVVSGSNQSPQGTVEISGATEVGSTVDVAIDGVFDRDGILEDTRSVQWFRNGDLIEGATDLSYVLTAEEIGASLTVELSYTDFFGRDEITSSTAFFVGDDQGSGSDDGSGNPGDDGSPTDDDNDTPTDEPDEPDVPQIGDGVNDTPVTATPFPDVFVVRDGVTFIDGLGGDDTAVFTGSRSDYTISVGDDETRVVDTRPDGHGTVTLQNVELIRFELPDSDGDDTLVLRQISTELSVFDSLNAQELDTLVEMYIAYFNRAPDADGLAFWSASYLDGYSIEDIAGMFAAQPELEALYPEDQNPVRFVADVYDNVFGRAPDLQGLTFWKDVLADGSVSPDAFILEVLRGVDAEPSSGAPQARIDQQVSDQEYLDLKTDLGIHFAVTRGLTSVEDAATILDGFDGSQASFDATIEEIDALYAEAVLLTSPADDVSVVGVTDTVTDM